MFSPAMMKLSLSLNYFLLLYLLAGTHTVVAGTALIDDRSSGTLQSSNAGEWRLVTDQVMGGVSSGSMSLDSYRGRDCIRMRGSVSTENNGGFLQIVLDLADGDRFDASAYQGVLLQVAGNGERYNLHLRTSDLWLPWQSYRATFVAGSEWSELSIPFAAFEAYRTRRDLKPERLIRIGLVAIGREFDADLCLAMLRFYRNDESPPVLP